QRAVEPRRLLRLAVKPQEGADLLPNLGHGRCSLLPSGAVGYRKMALRLGRNWTARRLLRPYPSAWSYATRRLKLIDTWWRRMWPTASMSPLSMTARVSAISRRKIAISSPRLRRGTDFSQMRLVR